MNTVRLTPEYYSQLLDKLSKLAKTSKDKNRDWYSRLQTQLFEFEEWYCVMVDGDIKAFSAVHKIGDHYRLLSRLWYDDCFRTSGLKTPLTSVTPAMLIAELQLEDFWHNVFCSMEYPQRRKHLEKVAERLNYRFGKSFKLNDGMHKTVLNGRDDNFTCWQNTISEEELDLPKISVEEWRLRFGNSRKMPGRAN